MTTIRTVTTLLAALVGVLLLAGAPAPARAQQGAPSAADMESAKKAFLEGKELHAAGKLDEAVEKFKTSYRLSRRPQLLYNIALTLEEMKKSDLAIFYYKKFLADAPADDAQRGAAEKSLAALQELVASQPPPDETGGEPDPERKPKKEKKPKRTTAYTAEDFQHTVVEDAPPGKPLDLTAAVPDDAGWMVTLNYRGAGDEKFTTVEMRSRYNELVARIPAAKMSGNAVQYYIEVRDAKDEVVVRTGKSTSPNVVYLDATAPDHFYTDLEETIDTGERGGEGDEPVRSGGGDDEDPLGVDKRRAGTKGSGRVDTADDPLISKRAGGGVVLLPGGPGYTDVGSKKFSYVKWGATGASLGMLTLSMTYYLSASTQSSNLEARALESAGDDSCAGGPPCDVYDDDLKAIEDFGRRAETISKVTFVVGLGAGVVAGYWWYKEIKARKKAERSLAAPQPVSGLDSAIAVPVAGDDYVGAAAALRF